MQQLQNVIESAFERRADITPANVDTVTREAVNQVISLLDSGALRVAEKIEGQWVTHQWLKRRSCSLSVLTIIRLSRVRKAVTSIKCR